MKIGVHGMLWGDQWFADPRKVLEKIKKLGFDFVEIPLLDLSRGPDTRYLRRMLEELELEACTSTAMLPQNDPSSMDPRIRENGIRFLERCIRINEELDAHLLCGVLYSPISNGMKAHPLLENYERAVESIRYAAEYARAHQVTLSMEAVNRYDNPMLNTARQCRKFVDAVGADNVKVHLDTYQMSIEEKNYYDAVMTAGEKLGYLHFCENGRGVPGSGLVNWEDCFEALRELEFQGYGAIEAFPEDMDGLAPEYLDWLEPLPEGDAYAESALAFLRRMQKKYSL